ncbi:MAG: Rpn family recombination-promoting nuclease/putative transposase [Treponema sp.]|nr:Rpn family recombination-promoting nuclease/putative transposase [Treponema sp.]
MSFINRKYKDSVFTDLFGSDRDGKKNFLELYNGLSGSDYKLEEVSIERKVIEQSLYKTYNNDVSWEIDGKLIVLVEHQSTINENMPFRCLEYVTRIYEGIFPQNKRYAENVFKIPNPDFYVVYIGKKDLPLEQELRLSDAFYKKDSSSLELIVKVRNCTNPRMLPIAKDCDILKQYCQFIEIVERTFNKRFPKRSFKKAIDTAISQGILSDYLDRKSREVTNMLCAKYDYKMDIAVKQEEAYEKGVQKKAIEAAKKMLVKNYPFSDICEITDLSQKQVKELYDELHKE